MPAGRLAQVLKAAVIAGIIAGLAMGLFHFFITERLIEQAIALEEATSPGNPTLVSREAQKVMLVVGSGLYGLIVGVIFAFVFTLLERRLPGNRSGAKAMLLAGIMWWFFGMLVQLKYPATLPGVGDPATIYFRQWLQIGFLAFSILAAVIVWITYRFLGSVSVTGSRVRLGIAALLYVGVMTLVFKLMPNNPPPPPELVGMSQVFRILSISGHAIFWVTLGTITALSLRRQHEKMPTPQPSHSLESPPR